MEPGLWHIPPHFDSLTGQKALPPRQPWLGASWGWRRRPCRAEPRHVLLPDFLVKPSDRKSSQYKLHLISA
ncbi:Hypothetical predicted protein [Marmota monax]|uniref:Uncharacterized protein n=1 Tax=Marmota monax TaxID=9995 RepID=A0A5E4ARU7_MARMO|nr:Hypothetical predicted protein [Marmota monax]